MMNHQAYITRLAEKFGVSNCKDVHTPVDSNLKLVKVLNDEVFVPKFPYCAPVSALMYVTTYTRPDIAHAVGEAVKYCKRHRKSHWAAAKRILK